MIMENLQVDYALSCRKPYTWYTIALNSYFALLVISATIMFLVNRRTKTRENINVEVHL